jgi:peroxiredoxin
MTDAAPSDVTSAHSASRRILFALPVAAVILAGLVAWKLTRPPAPPVVIAGAAARLVPKLELMDSRGQLFRLRSHLGRSRILVAFFRADTSFAESPLIQALRESHADLSRAAPVIVAVGPLQSGMYRYWMKDTGPLPFHVVGDVLGEARRDWGLPTEPPLKEAVFLIDRAGSLRFSHVEPDLKSPADWIRELQSVR